MSNIRNFSARGPLVWVLPDQVAEGATVLSTKEEDGTTYVLIYAADRI